MLLILALRRQKQVGFCEFKVGLVYKVKSRPVRAATQSNPDLQNQNKKRKNMIKMY